MDLSGLSNAEYRVLVTGRSRGGCYRGGSRDLYADSVVGRIRAAWMRPVSPEEADVGGVVTGGRRGCQGGV
ncbi:hypothetical protein O9992_29515 [Vibrio lentus]|nr:hypothetical protein [Vibrio lentus]